MKNYLKTVFSVLAALFFLILAIGSSDDDKPENNINIGDKCEHYKNECLSYIHKKGPSLIRDLKYIEEQKNSDINSSGISEQQIMTAIRSLSFITEVDGYETYMRNNCPEIFSDYQMEAGAALLIFYLTN
jgi:hypothetical protein